METNPIKFVIMFASTILVGREVEPLWSIKKMSRVLGVGVVSGAAFIFLQTILTYRIEGDSDALFAEASYGSSGVVTILLLGLKQERSTTRLPFLPARWDANCGHLVSIAVLIAIVLGLMLGMMADAWLCVVGAVACWIDLRFFCPGDNGCVGDARDNLAFHSFFPAVCKPHLDRITSILSRTIGRSCGCVLSANARRETSVRRSSDHRRTAQSGRSGGESGQADEQSLIAERRRARAIKALDAKLKEIEELDDEPLDDWEDAGDMDAEDMGVGESSSLV